MPNDVADALKKIFIKEGNLDEDGAEKCLKELDRTRRFQSETWT